MTLYKAILIFVTAILISIFMLACKGDEKQGSDQFSEQKDPALEKLSELLRQQPDDPELRYERAKLYYKKEAYDEAIDDIVLAQKKDSIKADYYHLMADIYLDYYKSYEALQTMEKVVSLHPQRIPSLLKLSEFQYILKQYDASINTLNNVFAVDRLEPEAFFMLGMNFRAKKDLVRAKNSFQTAVENDPDLIDAWLMLGDIYEEENDPLALTFYENALIVAPDNVEALHAKAFYLQNHDQISEAIAVYKKINVIDPQYEDAFLNTGLLYLELDSIGSAFEHFNILVNMDITNPIAYFYRAFSHEKGGQLEKAKADYEQALRLAPDFIEAKEALNNLLSTKED